MVGCSLVTHRYIEFKKIHQHHAADAKIKAHIKT